MNLENLEPGTKLIWDAPEPFVGYSENLQHRPLKKGRVYYTCVVTNRKSTNPLLRCHIQTIGNSFHWMGHENEYLRLPTEDELNTLTFPTPKHYE